MLKRIISLLIAVVTTVSISACSGNEKKGGTGESVSAADMPYYAEKEIGEGIGLKNPGQGLAVDSQNRVVVFDNSTYIFIDKNGKKASEVKVDFKGGGSIFTLDSKDNIYVVSFEYPSDAGDAKSFDVTYRLISYSAGGKKLSAVELGKRTVDREHAGISDIAVDSKGNIYLLTAKENIEVYSAEGKKVKDIPAPKMDYMEMDSGDNLILAAFNGGNDRSVVEKLSTKGETVWKKDMEAGDFLRQFKYSKKDNTIYLLCEKGIKTCTPEGKMNGYIFNSVESSLVETSVYIRDFAVNPGNNITALAFKSDSSSGTYTSKPLLYTYTELKGDQIPKKRAIISLALAYSDRFIEAAVSEYQKSHPGIRLDVKDYKAAFTGTGDDETQRAQKAGEDFQKTVSTEIMAGKGADIIEVESLPYRKFVDKNALVNLNDMMKQDRDYKESDYNQKILNACKYKGNLYILPTSFSFMMMSGNKSILDKAGIKIDDGKWTWDDFIKIAKSITKDTNGDGKPDQYGTIKLTSEDNMFGYMCDIGKFVDYDKKTASFNSNEFIGLLKKSREAAGYNIYHPKIGSNTIWEMKDPGTIGFFDDYISGYSSLVFSQALANGEVVHLNRPSTADCNNKPFMQGKTFAINNNSKYKSEAWEFLKLLISEKMQTSTELYNLPISLSAQKQKAKEFLGQSFWYETYHDQQGRNIKKVTQNDIDDLDKVIGEVGSLPYNDANVSKIVTENVKEFFAGNKTAEETANIIQNKVSTYLGE